MRDCGFNILSPADSQGGIQSYKYYSTAMIWLNT